MKVKTKGGWHAQAREKDRRQWEVVWQIACSVYVILLTFKLLIAFKSFMRFEVNLHIHVLKVSLRYASHVSASISSSL